ncbi:hypothetical protein ACOSQ3_024862 [Xanthoceras sorbifolium]
MQQKWLTKLLGYDYDISYKKGKENVVADGLSKAFQEEEVPSHLALSTTKPAWIQEVEESYYMDPKAATLIPEILIGRQANQEFTLREGILCRNGVIYVGNYGHLRQKLVEEAHSSAMGGHSGIQGTMKRLQLYFYWDSMLKEVTAKVLGCAVCQENKSLHSKPSGLLQPLPIPNTPWLDIAMDFIEGLPRSAAYRLLLPPGSQIHPVFHVSQLKPKIGDRFSPNPQLPHTGPDGQILAQPVAILDRKMVKKDNKAVVQYLIQWSASSPEDATWEDADMIRRSFPSFDP